MGRLFAKMGRMYAWATPEYLLDHMTFAQILLYYKYGPELEKENANLLKYKFSWLMAGKPEPPEPKEKDSGTGYQAPDRKALQKAYPNLQKGQAVTK